MGRALLLALVPVAAIVLAWLASVRRHRPAATIFVWGRRFPGLFLGAALGIALVAGNQVALHPLGALGFFPPADLEIPGPAPAFSLEGLEGEKISLRADLEGRVILLNYWASWCAPCRTEIPELLKLEEDWGEQGLAVFLVNQGETRESIEYYQTASGRQFRVYLATPKLLRLYPERGLPTTYLIDRQGQVRERFVGYGDDSLGRLKDLVYELLQEPADL